MERRQIFLRVIYCHSKINVLQSNRLYKLKSSIRVGIIFIIIGACFGYFLYWYSRFSWTFIVIRVEHDSNPEGGMAGLEDRTSSWHRCIEWLTGLYTCIRLQCRILAAPISMSSMRPQSLCPCDKVLGRDVVVSLWQSVFHPSSKIKNRLLVLEQTTTNTRMNWNQFIMIQAATSLWKLAEVLRVRLNTSTMQVEG